MIESKFNIILSLIVSKIRIINEFSLHGKSHIFLRCDKIFDIFKEL